MNLDVIPITSSELRELYQSIQWRKRCDHLVGEWNQIWWAIKTNARCMKRDYLLPKERTDA